VVAEAFLGRGFLTDVYTVDYSLADKEATLFLTRDENGDKFNRWTEVAEPDGAGAVLPSGITYEEGMAAILEERYYGRIIAGVVNGRLAGIVGYTPAHEQALREWLESLPAPSH
jgi:hypothetical protein